MNESQREALWKARTWELFTDGHALDLPAFNMLDYCSEQDRKIYQVRRWPIRLREIPAGLHTLRYVMHINQEVEGDPEGKSAGTYELILNFTFDK